ncbi:hypothetical protein GCM10007866_10320 [Gluconobacter albidus]|uniref:Uncharacterized protein n=1 Tax=Gluconobacter albidus TaxID=318683 RepID=A0ABQ5X137_9PROT|nr:hypothetical protein GCM10007866_10320 [Gluconobacter albidus]
MIARDLNINSEASRKGLSKRKEGQIPKGSVSLKTEAGRIKIPPVFLRVNAGLQTKREGPKPLSFSVLPDWKIKNERRGSSGTNGR